MGFKCGIVGLPNVGKSTLFNALTSNAIPAENYPFCTIDPNVGIVEVPDTRLDELVSIVTPNKTIPTTMEFVDIAGLVAGASKGEGLGNQFLAHIRETDAIAQVVRCFEDENVTHVSGRVDPADDIDVINTELALADLDAVEKAIIRADKRVKIGDKEAKVRLTLLERIRDTLDQGRPVRSMEFSEEDREQLRDVPLLTAKPVMYLANVADDGFDDNPLVARVQAIADAEGAVVVTICAAIEAELAGMDDEDKLEFLQDMGQSEPGLNRVIRVGYALLDLETYFTAGVKEVRAWTIPVGSTAPQAAGKIHTDFEKGFIRAEVVGYDDFVACGGEQGAKEAGKWRLEGKDYRVQDGDVVHFRFNV